MDETINILKELIKIPSFVDKNSNENKVSDYIIKFIKNKTKYKYYIQQVEKGRKNILVFNKPNPKIALFGHMDTVLPKAETNEPFNPKIDKNKIYGLGAVDMKGGLAIMLDLAQSINNDNLAFVFSVDEEYEFKGAQKLKEFKNFNPHFIINVEPTDNKILNGCRGITEFSFAVHGKSVHAGRKKFGINAIEKSVQLVKIFQKELTKTDVIDSGKTTINLAYLHGGTLKMSNSKKTEISELGMVVPNYAKLNCEIRIANFKITQKFIQNKLQEIAKKLKVKVDDFYFKFYLGSMITPKSELQKFEKAIKDSNEKVQYADINVSGYYEVQLLQEKWNSKSVIFGPGPISLSHSVNEYITISSIKKTKKILTRLINNDIS